MPLVTGATAAGFRIVRLLGVGAIGEVYLAEHPRLPRRYALTILPTDVSADPEYREQFNRESDLAAALWHPHIVGLHDRGEFEGRLWISVDYIDGADAAQLLSDTYPDGMPPDEVVEIVTAIADALDYAHDHGLLHRHVKPGNILITQPASDNRRILLADFGVARRLDGINGLTQANLTVGTVSYAAPEQLMGGSIDGRADQYALASTAFHLLTGSPPFAHTNPAVVISKHLNEPPPRPGDVRPELAHFDEPISRALAKVSTDRFPRCQDFANALEANHSERYNHRDAGATAVLTRPAPPSVPEPPPVAAASPVVAASPAAVASPDAETDAMAPTEPIAANLLDAETGAVVLTEPMAADLPDAGAAGVALAEPAAPAPPDAEADDAVYPPDVSPDTGIGDALTPLETAVSGTTTDHEPVRSLGRLLPRVATVVLAIAVVLIGFFVVMALRSRSWSQLPPTTVETPSSVTTIPPALPAPATATAPPTTTAPAPETTTPPPTTTPPSSPAPTTTTPPLST
ncbi:MAG: serine/threonine-protein kinase, partial [Mycobacterium sp.]